MSSLSSEAISAIACLGAAILPTFYGYLPTNVVILLNIGSTSVSFGTHVWVGSIAGLTMIRTLQRRTFGIVQSKLFPKYALLNTSCSLLTLTSYMYLKGIPLMDARNMLSQPCGMGLIVGLVSNLLNSFIFIGKTSELMFKIHKREHELGLPNEVSTRSPLGKSDKATESDRKLLKKFGMFHGMSMLMSLASVGAAGYYLWCIAKSVKV